MAFSKHNHLPRTSTFYERPDCKFDKFDISESDITDGPQNYDFFNKIYMFGEHNDGFKTNQPLQNYEELLQYHLQNKSFFNDDNFSVATIALNDFVDKNQVKWKRPHEICSNPKFIVDGATRFDIDQGELGDCWFLASVANLTTNQKIFSMIVPQDQSFAQKYAGIFHFRFWQYGRWVDIVIDDKLPTINNKLIYLHSDQPNEFWPALLEKAYAKFYGSYKNIEGGRINEALEDLCGGLSEVYKVNCPKLAEIMEMSFKKSAFMGCSIPSVNDGNENRPDGLVENHAYSITGFYNLQIQNKNIKLIRIRNPWGQYEWNGPWSDSSKNWNWVHQNITDQILDKKADGEFWMDFNDFQKCFIYVDICHPNPGFYFEQDEKWNVHMFEGFCGPNISKNQYILVIRGDKEQDVVIGLMQKFRREMGKNELPLAIVLYQIERQTNKLTKLGEKVKEGERQVTVRFLLTPGKYCIVPEIEVDGVTSYLLRIYSDANSIVQKAVN